MENIQNQSTNMKHAVGDLAQMQSLPLEAKIEMSKRRIREWYEYWGGQVYVSFSGGKDSTVLLYMVRCMYPDVEAVFVDTGLEYPEVRQFVKKWENVTIIRPKMNFKQVIQKYRYPLSTKELARKIYYARRGAPWAQKFVDGTLRMPDGRPSRYTVSKKWLKLMDAPFEVSNYCCDVMKKQPLHRYQKETGNYPYVGTMACEGSLREQAWMRAGCNAFEGRVIKSAPLSFWTEQDILQYILNNHLGIAPVYGDIVTVDGHLQTSGCDRTGCMFCMFGCAFREKSE